MKVLGELISSEVEKGKLAKFTVVGNSMFPLFRDGKDNVILKKADKVKNHDVVFYRREDGSYVLHRVIGKGLKGYKLCGDDQIVVEYPVNKDEIIAVMTGFERNGIFVSSSNPKYRLYVGVWCWFRKLRPLILKTGHLWKLVVKNTRKFIQNKQNIRKNMS